MRVVELPTESEPVRVIEGDALDLIHVVPDGVVKCVLTDPPYGIALASNGTWFRSMRGIENDATQSVGQEAIDACEARGWPVLAFASPLLPWRGDWRQALVWDKGGAVGIGGDRATCWKRSWELVQLSRRFGVVNGTRDEAVLRFGAMPSLSAEHPAAKPVALMRYLIRKLTSPDDVILDPFCGIGSTLVAAACEGRRAIGFEIDPAYAAIARRRVREAMGTGLLAGVTP